MGSLPVQEIIFITGQKLIIIIRLYISGSISKTHLCNISTVSLRYYRWVLERDLMISKKDK